MAAVPRTTPPTSAITAVEVNGDAPQLLIGCSGSRSAAGATVHVACSCRMRRVCLLVVSRS